MNLDLGSGGMQRGEEWVSVDRNVEVVVDVVADVRALPFRADAFDLAVAADVLEHMLPWDVHPVLAEWRRVLRSEGVLKVRVPNLERLGEELCTGVDLGSGGLANTIRNIYGGHRFGVDGALDTHHVGWTEDLIADELRDAALDVVHNDYALNMTVTAVKR